MRISDWSSDVCSSDLLPARREGRLDDRVLRIEAGKAEHADDADSGDGERARRHRPEGERKVPAKPAVKAHVLHVLHRVDDRACAQEKQRLIETVGALEEYRRAICAKPRSEGSRVGTDGVGRCRSRGWTS